MTRTPEQLRSAAYVSKRLALDAKDAEQRNQLFAMAADLERQAREADQARSGKDRDEAPAEPRKGRWIPRRRKST